MDAETLVELTDLLDQYLALDAPEETLGAQLAGSQLQHTARKHLQRKAELENLMCSLLPENETVTVGSFQLIRLVRKDDSEELIIDDAG